MKDSLDTVLATFARLYRLGLLALSMPVVLGTYFHPDTGADYDIDFRKKLALAVRMARNNIRIPTGSTFLEHLVIATRVLQIPADVDGPVVECGCYKGGSTANLSLVAARCDRSLEVFDSFEGMPNPSERDRAHILLDSGEIHTYEENSWQASLREVRRNVARYGSATPVRYHAGYFGETMPDFDGRPTLIFLDVGLRDSAETAVRHLWPRLVDGGYLFTHDVKHMEIATLFFDAEWWRETLDCEPPGLVGAGNGLGLHPSSDGFSSLLGYTVKNADLTKFASVEEKGEEGSNTVDTALVR